MSQNKASKAAGGASKAKRPAKAGADDKGEDVLQAVILADSFQDRFRPFTLEKPRCLLTLANTPLIEYTLEYLAMSGVHEVYIYCGPQIDQIETYISESQRWNPRSKSNPFQLIDFIRVSDAGSLGDFLRDLDGRGLISGDFILVHGDLVANIPLDGALAKHRARREANRDACMTMIVREAGSQNHRTKTHGFNPVFVIEPSTNRCLHYDEMNPLDADRRLTLDPQILKHPEFEVRADLIDCGIDICTPDVLALWSESYDFELPRKNFLHSILNDWELNGKMIYADIVDEHYAARASNLQMYESISRDVLGRWTYPLVPDSNLVRGSTYNRQGNGVYAENGVSIEALTNIDSSVLGRRTCVGSGSSISNSTIGRHCKIGENVRIEHCFLWDDVEVGDNTTISRSILADHAVVGKDCTIPPGSLISFGVHVSDSISFSQPPVLSLLSHESKQVSPDTNLLGPNGKGAAYRGLSDDDDDDDNGDISTLQKSFIFTTAHLNLSASSISTLNTDTDETDDEGSQPQSAVTSDPNSRSRLSSFASDDSGTTGLKGTSFHADAVHGILDALRDDESADFEGAKLEFMGLRLATDASDAAVRRAVAVAFARRAAELLSPEHGGLEPTKAAGLAIKSKAGAAKFLSEVGVAAQQVEFVLALQKALAMLKSLEPGRAGILLAAMLQQLYDIDALEEEGILAWWEDKRSHEGETMAAVRARCKVLVEWLENADDESDEEDSE